MDSEPLSITKDAACQQAPAGQVLVGARSEAKSTAQPPSLAGGSGLVESVRVATEGVGGAGVGGVYLIRRLRREALRAGLFVCYECKADRCGYCIGVPCMCECPIPETEPEYAI